MKNGGGSGEDGGAEPSFSVTPRKKTARKDVKEEEEEDIISSLRDAILIHILSFLPTGDSIMTGVLSKKWAYLWTFVPCLSFDVASFYKDDECDVIYTFRFFAAVDRALTLYKSHQIRRFEARFYFLLHDQPYIDRWIRIATKGNVEHLRLESVSECLYTFPEHFYDNSSLVNLELGNWDIGPIRQIRWSSLKSLSIWDVELDFYGDMMPIIISGCLLLEFLLLVRMCGMYCLDLTCSNLRELVMRDYTKFSGREDYGNLLPIFSHWRFLGISRSSNWSMHRLWLMLNSVLIGVHMGSIIIKKKKKKNFQNCLKEFLRLCLMSVYPVSISTVIERSAFSIVKAHTFNNKGTPV